MSGRSWVATVLLVLGLLAALPAPIALADAAGDPPCEHCGALAAIAAGDSCHANGTPAPGAVPAVFELRSPSSPAALPDAPADANCPTAPPTWTAAGPDPPDTVARHVFLSRFLE